VSENRQRNVNNCVFNNPVSIAIDDHTAAAIMIDSNIGLARNLLTDCLQIDTTHQLKVGDDRMIGDMMAGALHDALSTGSSDARTRR